VSVDANDEERDRRELTADGDDRERVEELVVQEHGRARIRAPERVDDRNGGDTSLSSD
jgi:hypothetical protein